MAVRWQTFPIKFEGGLISNLGKLEQGIAAPGSATTLQNFEVSIKGGYDKVLGYEKFSTTVVPNTGQIVGVITPGINEVLVLRNSNYYYSTGTSWTNKGTTSSGGQSYLDFDTYKFAADKKTVVVDGVNVPAFFNHTSKALAFSSTTEPEVIGAKSVKVFKNHLFYGKNNFLTFAAPFTDDDFTPANGAGQINIGDDIVDLIVFREQLIIFCVNSIYRLTGNTLADFILQPITRNTGCIAPKTVQEVGGDIMYLGPDGIRYLSATERVGDFGLTRASEKIQQEVVNLTSGNPRFSSVTISKKNQYRIFSFLSSVLKEFSEGFIATKFSNQTVEDIAWSKQKGIKVHSIDKVLDNDSEFIAFCSDTDYVYRLDSGSSYDGANIECIFETPYMPISDPKIRKTFYKHTLYVKPNGLMNLMCGLRFDYLQSDVKQPPVFYLSANASGSIYGSSSTVYGSALYGSSSEGQYYDNVLGSAFVVALRYYDNSTNPSFNLNFANLEFRQNERN